MLREHPAPDAHSFFRPHRDFAGEKFPQALRCLDHQRASEIDAPGKPASRFGAKTEKDPPASKNSEGMAASAEHGLFASDTYGDRLLHFDRMLA